MFRVSAVLKTGEIVEFTDETAASALISLADHFNDDWSDHDLVGAIVVSQIEQPEPKKEYFFRLAFDDVLRGWWPVIYSTTDGDAGEEVHSTLDLVRLRSRAMVAGRAAVDRLNRAR